jgi:hypothetical protein
MADNDWKISGDYFETCSCDFLCPCIPGQLNVQPTKGTCTFAMAFHINQGRFNTVTLDNLNFVVVGRTPEKMVSGNWQVGLIVDEQANQEQQESLTAINTGAAGGPMAILGPFLGAFLGVEARPIHFQGQGNSWSVSVPGLVDQAGEGVQGIGGSSEPLYLDNTGHPAANRFALAKAVRSHIHAFGMDWDDESGKNNSQFAPFQWQG